MRTTSIYRALCLAAFVAGLVSAPAAAQDWPTKPIRILVGFGAGGGTDIVTRIIADPLGELLGQAVITENKPGAGGSIASEATAKSAPDGYTASMLSAGHTVSAVMFKSLNYDSVKDFAPVGMVANSAFVIVTRKDFPANDIKGLIAAAKASPGKLNFASVGIGSTQHFTGELFRQSAGIEVVHIGHRGTPAVITGLLRKDVDYAVELAHAVAGQVQAGELKILAVTTPKRWPTLPDVPTLAEAGVPNCEVLGWYGLVFPANTPKPVIDKAYNGLKQVLAREDIQKRIAGAGALVNLTSPQDFGKHLASEVAKWRDVAKKSGIEPK
ncbi:MAG: tripartite tricarboxylate transporter substrate binding protein [Rhizobiales bacterium]|nr:tripartite tricarboxylate transporter substrate binding protein [Hyphomicrobiales bacterium]